MCVCVSLKYITRKVSRVALSNVTFSGCITFFSFIFLLLFISNKETLSKFLFNSDILSL